jgi:hypothetical protein
VIYGTAEEPDKKQAISSILGEGPFVYIGARAFLDTGITKEIACELAKRKGELVDLVIEPSGQCLEAKIVEVDEDFGLKKDDVLDGSFYRFYFEVLDGAEVIEDLRAEKDRYIDSETAFKQHAAHWGTERWSGLRLSIRDKDGTVLHRTRVDVFAPGDDKSVSKKILVYGAYSHTKEFVEQLSREGFYTRSHCAKGGDAL